MEIKTKSYELKSRNYCSYYYNVFDFKGYEPYTKDGISYMVKHRYFTNFDDLNALIKSKNVSVNSVSFKLYISIQISEIDDLDNRIQKIIKYYNKNEKIIHNTYIRRVRGEITDCDASIYIYQADSDYDLQAFEKYQVYVLEGEIDLNKDGHVMKPSIFKYKIFQSFINKIINDLNLYIINSGTRHLVYDIKSDILNAEANNKTVIKSPLEKIKNESEKHMYNYHELEYRLKFLSLFLSEMTFFIKTYTDDDEDEYEYIRNNTDKMITMMMIKQFKNDHLYFF